MSYVRTASLWCCVLSACGWAYPAIAQSQLGSETRPAMSALQVVKDPVTGRLRAPTAEEMAAQQATTAAQSRSRSTQIPAAQMFGPDHPFTQHVASQANAAPAARLGAVAKRADVNKMHFSMARRSANGGVETECVAGESAAAHALHNSTNTNDAKGAQHDR
jgi:hypothetical protein